MMHAHKYLILVLALSFFYVSSQQVSAQGLCEVWVDGEVRDALDNVVWDVADYGAESGTSLNSCLAWAGTFVYAYSYSLCVARSSGVDLDFVGDVYHNSSHVDTLSPPGSGSCRDDFNLNHYTVIAPDQTLYADAPIYDPSNNYRLLYQQDGNLVLYDTWNNDLWASGSASAPGKAVMQSDGNLVVYSASDAPQWSSDTYGNSGAFLALRPDGQMVIYGPDGAVLWHFCNC